MGLLDLQGDLHSNIRGKWAVEHEVAIFLLYPTFSEKKYNQTHHVEALRPLFLFRNVKNHNLTGAFVEFSDMMRWGSCLLCWFIQVPYDKTHLHCFTRLSLSKTNIVISLIFGHREPPANGFHNTLACVEEDVDNEGEWDSTYYMAKLRPGVAVHFVLKKKTCMTVYVARGSVTIYETKLEQQEACLVCFPFHFVQLLLVPWI